ncbi:MAG: hypothetical protein SGJ18_16105 [Pseudomonadota bacterium]|nr:hypothetical protein [Pseudomonadota bacterium]
MKKDSIYEWTIEWGQIREKRVWIQDSVTSTNDIAKEQGFSYDLYLTNHQTHGRGQKNSTWLDDRCSALLSSWTFKLSKPPQPIASPLFGLALFTSLKTVWPNLPFSLKAPNDVFLGNKKLAGLLLEVVSTGSEHLMVLGLGINVFAAPESLPEATYLSTMGVLVTKTDWQRFLDVLQTYFSEMSKLSILQEMPAGLCEQIRSALNQCPLKKAYIQKVESNGHIITEIASTPWL